jgi:hypothetical protein
MVGSRERSKRHKPVRQVTIDVIRAGRKCPPTMASELEPDMASAPASEMEMDRSRPEASNGQWCRMLPRHVRRQHGRR